MEPIKLQRTFCREETISRIPALFAYLEYTEQGNCVLHPASDSVDGCYGHVVSPIKIEQGFTIEDEVIIEENEVISYREMMNLYYTYRDDERVGRDNAFIKFVEDGIGEIDLLAYATGIDMATPSEDPCEDYAPGLSGPRTMADVWTKMPEKIYLSQVMDYIYLLKKIKAACRIADATRANNELDVEACCLCEDYEKYGGDTIYNYLIELSELFVSRSHTYLEYADMGGIGYTLNIPLYSHIKDVGLMDVYFDEVAEEYYKEGTIVTHTEYDEDGFRSDIKTLVIGADADIHINGCDTYIDLDNRKLLDTANNELANVSQRESEDISDIEGVSVTINSSTKSRLTSLRSGKSYMDASSQIIKPAKGQDWLWYYKTDRNYNVRDVEYDEETGKYKSYHCDYISDISYDDEEGTVTFIYYINSLYYISENTWTHDDRGAMKFTETYDVLKQDVWDTANTTTTDIASGNDTDLEKMINGTDISMYTTGSDDDVSVVYPDATFPFDTATKIIRTTVAMGNKEAPYDYIRGDYELKYKHEEFENCKYRELLTSPIFKRTDFSGFVFKPDVHNDVYIQRGDNAAFERHIRLSEIKTLDDLMDYSNGGYYTVEQLT